MGFALLLIIILKGNNIITLLTWATKKMQIQMKNHVHLHQNASSLDKIIDGKINDYFNQFS